MSSSFMRCPVCGFLGSAPRGQLTGSESVRCNKCKNTFRVSTASGINAEPDNIAPEPVAKTPKQIGRFKILQPIGQGGFGTVYLAYDPQLEREVAVKLP